MSVLNIWFYFFLLQQYYKNCRSSQGSPCSSCGVGLSLIPAHQLQRVSRLTQLSSPACSKCGVRPSLVPAYQLPWVCLHTQLSGLPCLGCGVRPFTVPAHQLQWVSWYTQLLDPSCSKCGVGPYLVPAHQFISYQGGLGTHNCQVLFAQGEGCCQHFLTQRFCMIYVFQVLLF